MPPSDVVVLPEPPPGVRLPPDVRDTVSRYRLDVEDGRTFLLTLDRGRLSLEEPGTGEADCVLRGSRSEILKLLAGELNLLTALMRGDIHISGNIESARRLYRFLHLAGRKGEHS